MPCPAICDPEKGTKLKYPVTTNFKIKKINGRKENK